LLCHAAPEGAAMLSKPLACASTLDRPPPDARPECRRPSWRRSGARRPRRFVKCAGKSSSHGDSVIHRAKTRRDLSLWGGASIPPRASSSWASPRGSSPVFASGTTKATLWVALGWSCYAARDLACTPPSEGASVPVRAVEREPTPARDDRRDGRRLDREDVGSVGGRHRSPRRSAGIGR